MSAGLDELTVEHILFSHPVLVSMLVELINLIMHVCRSLWISFELYGTPI